jgi:two-component system osmolarity sensor histidine kinase EnvZ
MIESLASDMKIEGSELLLHRKNPPCVYFTDAVALERVLTNLLKNAAQHGRGKPIDINLNCSDDEVAVEICDRGPGIPVAEVDTVFKPFHRLRIEGRDQVGGSGLGLAIAHQIAIKHDWKIELLPREGGGTVAKLSLPTTRRFGMC